VLAAAGVTGAGRPLLVKRTQLVDEQVNEGFSSEKYPAFAYIRPTCGRFVVQYRGRGEHFPHKESDSTNSRVDSFTGEIFSDTERRSASRRRSAISDFCAHNGLGYLLTLTYANEPLSMNQVWRDFENFVRRVRGSLGGAFPYVGVIERGEENGRLHLHICAGRWYVDLGACVRCRHCVTEKWVWRSSPPEEGTLCIGCLWGNGIVHGPQERIQGKIRANGDCRAAALYVSSYVSKELAAELGKGRQLYRVAQNFQPSVLKVPAYDVDSARRYAWEFIAKASGVSVDQVAEVALHEVVEDWPGFPTWVGSVPLPELPCLEVKSEEEEIASLKDASSSEGAKETPRTSVGASG